MLNNKIYLCFGLCAALFMPAWADNYECLKFKKTPVIQIKIPAWNTGVVQPGTPMDLLHGNVIATLSEEYNISANAEYVDGGVCIVLNGVIATIGYSDFLVKIDSRHTPNSCTYNAIMDHEQEHISAHLGVIDDNQTNIKQSVTDAADSITPIFVGVNSDADMVLDTFNKHIQNHPGIILLKQKLKAEEEIRNKKIDQNETNTRFEKCRK